jgi:GNAT superfamily N-acetyltransferase
VRSWLSWTAIAARETVKVTLVALELLTSADGAPFQELFAIYASSIAASEQKPEGWLRAMVAAPEYRVWISQDAGHVLGFSILFVPPDGGFALLEYMAVVSERRGHGFGAKLFQKTVERAVTPEGETLPVVLEVDSDVEPSSDRALRTRRLHFYRRLGCMKVSGLRYLMPLPGAGPVPEMVLMIYRAGHEMPVPRRDLERWLTTIYRDVYHVPPDDPRIAKMLAPLPDPVGVE